MGPGNEHLQEALHYGVRPSPVGRWHSNTADVAVAQFLVDVAGCLEHGLHAATKVDLPAKCSEANPPPRYQERQAPRPDEQPFVANVFASWGDHQPPTGVVASIVDLGPGDITPDLPTLLGEFRGAIVLMLDAVSELQCDGASLRSPLNQGP
jgi:hypothetical protein